MARLDRLIKEAIEGNRRDMEIAERKIQKESIIQVIISK